ncbi:hypothetical protein Scep_009345 [Stephania cephalantha]|uniref:Uncharacterized protein n=1 Tax=Stephania cephalantha TaxID=152367 RepID=A0AAP0JTL6_9MAGN
MEPNESNQYRAQTSLPPKQLMSSLPRWSTALANEYCSLTHPSPKTPSYWCCVQVLHLFKAPQLEAKSKE